MTSKQNMLTAAPIPARAPVDRPVSDEDEDEDEDESVAVGPKDDVLVDSVSVAVTDGLTLMVLSVMLK